ncbi:DEAD box RNA helicase, putative [Chondrus crispus]|uniref:RNA helicase n=1 Tax=Chondrus crispus TaxID=2769 RepID=R7QHA2_CHOCR|nr:DEAD box RNA helicase, putative [Chondrus crispus]CDF37128.1 DEAD box RNA helicase, putative [Chondrus crispus]|eukprot:XP_005716947.1 DEAD box RNA helicase, putative [Chondrus crispus]
MSAAVTSPTLEAALAHMGTVSPTAAQRRAIPSMRAGNDVVAVAPTGSGKTPAYAVPLLSELLSGSRAPNRSAPHALVLAPTRELAEQQARMRACGTLAVERYRTGEVWVLIAIDVLARGLDFVAVESVVNYDMPISASADVHRIGRTGRNGRKGTAVTLFTREDRVLLGPVLEVAEVSGADVPKWALKLKGVRKDVVRRMEKRPPTRKGIGGPNRGSIGKRHKQEKRLESGSRTEEGVANRQVTGRKEIQRQGENRRGGRKGVQAMGLNVATGFEEEEYE